MACELVTGDRNVIISRPLLSSLRPLLGLRKSRGHRNIPIKAPHIQEKHKIAQ